jgi:hypothetical protein
VTGSRRLSIAACAALLALGAGNARADDLPVGQFGAIGGVRQGVGQLGEVFGLGAVVGVRAGYHRSSTERKWTLGVGWSVMWGFFAADDPGISDESLRLLEMNLGLRVRRLLGEGGVPRFLVGTVGGTILRTNVPVPPDMDRTYAGPSLGIGVEQYLLGKYLLSVEWQYGVLVGGPGSLTGIVSFSLGTR